MDKKDAYEWIPYPEQHPNYKFYICKSYDGKTNVTFDTPEDAFRIEFEYEYTAISIYGNREAKSNGLLYSRLSRGSSFPGEPLGIVGHLDATLSGRKCVKLICGIASSTTPGYVAQDTTGSTYTKSGTYYYNDRGNITNYNYGGVGQSFIEYPPLGVNNLELDNYWTTNETYISCNFPIFETESQARNYIFSGGETLDGCINIIGSESNVDEDTKEYYIYNRYQQVSVSRGIITTEDVDVYHWLAERILYNGTDICLYRYDSSNPFKLKIKCGQGLIGSIFSNTGSGEVQDADYSQFTLDTLLYDSPFYSDYKIKYTDASGETEIETPDYQGYLGTLRTNIPIWNTEDDADDFLVGNLDVTEADNYNRISQDPTWQEVVTNTTGVVEEETEFGEVYTRNIFSQMYLCDTTALYEISNNLFDYTPDATIQGQWEKIKKGLEMYGSNPMDAVQGLRFYPFDLSQIFTNVQSQNYIYFGAYQQDLTHNVLKLIYANGYKDLGSMVIKRTYNDWRDFEPYTKLSIYLPYIGRFQLDLAKYYGKTVNVRYYIDIRTGACCACLIANGILLDWFDGIIGTEMPITLTDYASYAQNQISIIARNAGLGGLATAVSGHVINKELTSHLGQQAIESGGGEAFESLASSTAGKGGAAASAAGAAGVGAAVAVVGSAMIMKTRFDMIKNGIGQYNSTRGSSSAMINQFLPQYPTFMFEVQEIDESPYLNELYGRPTNASGRIGDFSGYLEAEDVMLICPIATDNERQEIIDLVRAGIYI